MGSEGLFRLLLYENLYKIFLTVFANKMTSKTKKAEMSVIAGCFYGLTHLLTNFTHSVHEGIYYCFGNVYTLLITLLLL